MNVAELIADAYRNCGHDMEEDPTPAEYSQGLRRLNSMLNAWSAERLQVYGIVSGISTGGYALTPGESAYTLGTGTDTVVAPTPTPVAPTTVTDNYLVADGVITVLVDASSNDVTVTLPEATTGTDVTVIRIDSSAFAVAVVPSAGNTIEDGDSFPLNSKWSGGTFRPNGASTWIVL